MKPSDVLKFVAWAVLNSALNTVDFVITFVQRKLVGRKTPEGDTNEPS
jgi:hypothetical protein